MNISMQRERLQLMAAAAQKQPAPTAHTGQIFGREEARKEFLLCTGSPAIHSCELELAPVLAEAHTLNLAILYCTNEF